MDLDSDLPTGAATLSVPVCDRDGRQFMVVVLSYAFLVDPRGVVTAALPHRNAFRWGEGRVGGHEGDRGDVALMPSRPRCTSLSAIVLKAIDDKPMASLACTLSVDGRTLSAVSGTDGSVVFAIPVTSATAALETGEYGWDLDLLALDALGSDGPNGGVSGAQQRLLNLGYDPGEIDGTLGEDTLDALRVFQAEHGIKADPPGTLDAATQAKLLEEHGS